MDSKQILTLNKRQSIVQRIDAMKASFSANKIKDKLSRYHYFGYPSQILTDKLISKIPSNTLDKNSVIAVINDFGLEVISQLQMLGYTSLILLCTESDDKLYNIIKYMVEKEFNFNKIVRLEENMEDKFDLVIANPPYEIGNAVITETMKHCEEAVVLMPIAKYKKDNLYKMINPECVESIHDCTLFDGAATFPEICNLKSNKNYFENYKDFEIQVIYDKKLLKFWKKQTERLKDKTYISHMCGVNKNIQKNLDSRTCHTTGIYAPAVVLANGVTDILNKDKSFREDLPQYIWNFLKPDKKIYEVFGTDPNQTLTQSVTIFKSESEKDNFVKWWYSAQLSGKYRLQGLSSILLRSLNRHTSVAFDYAIPNVDWTKSWTDEEILKDYGYTDQEIYEILKINDDLLPLNWNENKDGVEKL